jgi:hypothetical protein
VLHFMTFTENSCVSEFKLENFQVLLDHAISLINILCGEAGAHQLHDFRVVFYAVEIMEVVCCGLNSLVGVFRRFVMLIIFSTSKSSTSD